MPMYRRGPATTPRLVDEFDAGFGWLAHADEGGLRASHAIRGDNGVWILDPVDADGIDPLIDELGSVDGVAVCSSWHARDADTVANRFDVPVAVPTWMSRVRDRIDAPVLDYEEMFPDAAFEMYPRRALPRFEESILFHQPSASLYVADSLGTTPHHALSHERLAPPLFYRLLPPTMLYDLEPRRILVGHGLGIHEDATAALEVALATSRRRFPRALLHQLPRTVRNGIAAMRG